MARIRMMKQTEQVTSAQAFQEFLQHCKLKNLSEATTKGYRQHFVKFLRFFGEDQPVCFLNQNTVRDYVLHLQEVLQNPETINTNLRHFRAIVNYWSEQNYCQPVKIKLLRVQQKVKETYTDDELMILLKRPNIKQCSFAEYRNWMMVNFFIATGIRVGSLVDIRCKDVDFDNNCVTLQHTKNKKVQILPLPQTLLQVLKEFMKHRNGQDEDVLFCSELGGRMHSGSASHAIAEYNRNRGIKKTSVHLFRHSYARNWVLTGGDIFRLQKQLGHADLTMSKRYANIYDRDLHQGTEEFNLLNRLQQQKQKIKMK